MELEQVRFNQPIGQPMPITCSCSCGCGELVTIASPSKFKRQSRHFVNRDHFHRSRKNDITITCICGCGRTRELRQSEVAKNKGKFFNMQCKNEYYEKKNMTKQKDVAVMRNDSRIVRRQTNEVFNRINNDKSLICGANAISEIVGCRPDQVGGLARHQKYLFPKPAESIRLGSKFKNYYKRDDVIAYRDVYKSRFLQQSEQKDVSRKKGIDMASAMAFLVPNPERMLEYRPRCSN